MDIESSLCWLVSQLPACQRKLDVHSDQEEAKKVTELDSGPVKVLVRYFLAPEEGWRTLNTKITLQ